MSMAKNRQDFWANLGPRYSSKNKYIAIPRREHVARIIKETGVKSVLELGCNDGANLKRVEDYVAATGLDINPIALKSARSYCPKATFIQGSIYDLSQFKDDQFDLVFTCGVLIHIPSDLIAGIIKEQSRIASKLIFNIEHHGEKDSVYYTDGGVPHRFVTNYIKAYELAGLKAKVDSTVIVGNNSGDSELIYKDDGTLLPTK